MAIYKQGSSTTIGTKYANPQPNSGGNAGILNAITQNSSLFIRARVLDIVLNNDHPRFTSVGEWNGIGTIYFEPLDNNSITVTYAYPIFPQIKMYPLVNEIVLLAAIPSKFSENEKTVDLIYYYFPPIGIWNHPHHNAYPNITSNSQLLQQSANDYVNTSENDTFVRRVGDGSTEINLNFTQFANPNQDTFVEKANIHPLLPFNGDIIYEGRWGNSIRFGSTTVIPQGSTRPLIPNNWSSTGSNGDPITILRNGQPMNSTDEGWIPITENISNDLSSIYLTSYQQLNTFRVASELYQSYTTPPTFPSQYRNPQVILNSDRIVINAKTDSILLSAQQSIGMSTNGSVNIDASSHYISSNDIKLGSKNATQPVLLGNDTVEVLKQLTNAVKDLASILQVQRDYPGGVLATSFNSVAGNVLTQINSANGILAQLNNDSLKSKTTKVQ
jgi:hypothetical protein